MNNTTDIHPDAVLEAMLATALHPTKRRNLQLIHQVCAERHGLGSRDFSLKPIGESVQARGGLKVKALWNPQSADYRKLIEVWQAFAGGGAKLRELGKVRPEAALTRSIADPATRIIVEKLLRERNAFRAEVNILKSKASVTIDRRPHASAMTVHLPHEGAGTLEIPSGPSLSEFEREALEHSVSQQLWEDEGWTEERHGRVVRNVPGSTRTRTIFKPGFATAVRKILDAHKAPSSRAT